MLSLLATILRWVESVSNCHYCWYEPDNFGLCSGHTVGLSDIIKDFRKMNG